MSDISELKFDGKNFNKHTAKGMGLLEKSLKELGAGRSILIDKDNNIIAGNGIVEAAGQAGFDKVKIVETDGTEIIAVKRTDMVLDSEKGREMALADNATASADLEWDKDNIAEFFDPEDTEKWGLELDWDTDTEVEEDEAPEVNESEPAKSELGKVYQLGEHRLMCGDSTDAGSIAILMNGEKADMVFTDPPYGVNMQRSDSILNDNLDDDKLVNLLDKSVKNAISNSVGNQFWFIGFKSCHILEDVFKQYNLSITNYIVWVKPSIGLGKTGYRYQHEICLFSGKIDSNSESDVWEMDRDSSNVHPTMKPVGIPAKAVTDSKAKTCLDLFGGSGSTLIACEQLGRKCYMMELDPKYCDVIRKRYWKFTHDGNEEGWEEGTPAI